MADKKNIIPGFGLIWFGNCLEIEMIRRGFEILCDEEIVSLFS